MTLPMPVFIDQLPHLHAHADAADDLFVGLCFIHDAHITLDHLDHKGQNDPMPVTKENLQILIDQTPNEYNVQKTFKKVAYDFLCKQYDKEGWPERLTISLHPHMDTLQVYEMIFTSKGSDDWVYWGRNIHTGVWKVMRWEPVP